MNVHDTSRMEEVLETCGYQSTDTPERANLIIINTCSVREKSHEKVLSALGRYSRLKHDKDTLLAVAGCVAQQEGNHLLELAPAVDLVFSPDHIRDLPELVEQAKRKRRVQTGFADPHAYRFLQASTGPGASALVTIQKGCDNACAYCIVPSVRGPCVSRPKEEILSEVHQLVSGGVREVILIGQNVNAFRGGVDSEDDFVELLRDVDRIPGLRRQRFTTSNPKDFHADMADCFKELRTLCPWLHLPVQSGSTRILQRMKRGYTRDQFIGHVERVRAKRPDLSVGTDLIVGFPGETEADFRETLSLLEEIEFNYVYSFKFSPRPGTRAATFDDGVPNDEGSRRLQRLQTLQDSITQKTLSRMVGGVLEVLVEGPSRKGLPQLCGRTPGNQVLNIEGANGLNVGDLVEIEVTHAGRHSLTGRPRKAPKVAGEVMECSSR